MADAIYHFTWGTFCDWYVELVKGAFDDETKRRRRLGVRPDPGHAPPVHAVRHRGAVAREGERPYELIVAKWPEPEAQRDPHAKARDRLADRADRARSAPLRTELNVPLERQARTRIVIGGDRDDARAAVDRTAAMLVAAWPSWTRASCRPIRAARLGADRGRRRDRTPFRSRARSTSTPSAPACRRRSPPPRRSATASPRASPTRPSPSAPSPRRSRRPAPTMTPRRPAEAERLSARSAGAAAARAELASRGLPAPPPRSRRAPRSTVDRRPRRDLAVDLILLAAAGRRASACLPRHSVVVSSRRARA